MGEKKRDFKGVWIPREIWLAPELTSQEKMMWSEINSLDNEFGCVASNEHFRDTFQLSERQVQRIIKNLKDNGMIEVEINKAKDTRVIHIAGKFRRMSEEQLQDIEAWRRELVDKYRSGGS